VAILRLLVTVACDSGRLLCFGRVIYFFRPPIFRRPWANFRETLPHDAVCPEIVYRGVHMCPLTNLRGENPNFWRFSDPKSTLWDLQFPDAGKIGKSKTIASIRGYVRMSIPNMEAVPHPPLTSAVSLVWGRGWGRSTSNRYNFGCMTASDSLFDSMGRFSGSSYRMKHSGDRRSKGRCHGNQFWDCINCKWTLTEDNDRRFLCKGWFVFSHLWRSELLQAGDCQVGNWHVNCQHSSFSLFVCFTAVI